MMVTLKDYFYYIEKKNENLRNLSYSFTQLIANSYKKTSRNLWRSRLLIDHKSHITPLIITHGRLPTTHESAIEIKQ